MTWLIVFCSLVFAFGLIIGTVTGINWEARAAARDEREDRADAAADDFIAALHPPAVHHDEAEARRLAMARRTHPVYRQRRTSTAAFLAHADQAIAVVSEPGQLAEAFDVDAIIADFHADTDRFLATVVDKYRSPYPNLEES